MSGGPLFSSGIISHGFFCSILHIMWTHHLHVHDHTFFEQKRMPTWKANSQISRLRRPPHPLVHVLAPSWLFPRPAVSSTSGSSSCHHHIHTASAQRSVATQSTCTPISRFHITRNGDKDRVEVLSQQLRPSSSADPIVTTEVPPALCCPRSLQESNRFSAIV